MPTIILERDVEATDPEKSADALDLANIVQSAAKGITTVQEAPAIITVITDEQIRQRQLRTLDQLYDGVPGWYAVGMFSSNYTVPLIRGQAQAVQYLHDGLSLFDPNANLAATGRQFPMELVKRVEMITGPGGVLWGSNSLLGILNVITKDAEDIEGVEIGGEIGDGLGDRALGRAYVTAGASGLLGGRLKALVHASVESYAGAKVQAPASLITTSSPQPNAAWTFGPLTSSDQDRSILATLFAKVTIGDLQLRGYVPFAQQYTPFAFGYNPTVSSLPDDPRCPEGVVDPTCSDPERRARVNRTDTYDRYVVAEYRTRFADEHAGIAAHAYYQQFVRTFAPMQITQAFSTLQGGIAFEADLTSDRYGASIDGDVEITRSLRVQYGLEAFHEGKPDNARFGAIAGTQALLPVPYNLGFVPLLCPRSFDPEVGEVVLEKDCPLLFSFAADRTVFGGYVNPRFQPTKSLILDVGARVQAAPTSLGIIGYDPNLTVAGALVWGFRPNWYLKLNYTEGFRPPVFNNVVSNGQAIQFGGNRDLLVEQSDATQVEVNARLWKGDRRIRELAFRVDGSYTRITNFIQPISGAYINSGDRGITSAEALFNLYVQGDHNLQLGYTFLRVDTDDRGLMRSLPEHWIDVASVFTLVPQRLVATTRLKIVGAAEDPNRIYEYRGLTVDEMGTLGAKVSRPTGMSLDRLPPQAELTLGMSYSPTKNLSIRLTVENALGAHAYQPDPFNDYEPRVEFLPNPNRGFRAYAAAQMQL